MSTDHDHPLDLAGAADDVVSAALHVVGLARFEFQDLGVLAGYLEGRAEASLEHCPAFREAAAQRGLDLVRESMQVWLSARLVRDSRGDEDVRRALESSGLAAGQYGG